MRRPLPASGAASPGRSGRPARGLRRPAGAETRRQAALRARASARSVTGGGRGHVTLSSGPRGPCGGRRRSGDPGPSLRAAGGRGPAAQVTPAGRGRRGAPGWQPGTGAARSRLAAPGPCGAPGSGGSGEDWALGFDAGLRRRGRAGRRGKPAATAERDRRAGGGCGCGGSGGGKRAVRVCAESGGARGAVGSGGPGRPRVVPGRLLPGSAQSAGRVLVRWRGGAGAAKASQAAELPRRRSGVLLGLQPNLALTFWSSSLNPPETRCASRWR